MTSKPDLLEVLDRIPDLLNRKQIVHLCHAYGADVESTLRLVDEINAEMDAEEAAAATRH